MGSNLKLPGVDLDRVVSRATTLATELTYVAVGFAVIAAQKARQQSATVRAFVDEQLGATKGRAPSADD